MTTRLYHKDIYLPKLNIENKNFEPSYTFHAMQAAETDRYGIIELPAEMNLSEVEIFEIEVDEFGNLIKVVFRMPYNFQFDLCVAMLVNNCKVKTVWLNDKTDKHNTLDKSKYEIK
jgi:hypothetical protein